MRIFSNRCVALFPLLQIVLQTLLAFAVTCYGIVHIAGEFKDMDATSELKNKYVLFLLINTHIHCTLCKWGTSVKWQHQAWPLLSSAPSHAQL